MIIRDSEPKIFDKEPKKITLSTAEKIYNSYNQNLGAVATVSRAIQDFAEQNKESFTAGLQTSFGQAEYAIGEAIDFLQPEGGKIYNGTSKVDTSIGDSIAGSLKESGRLNIETANRNLEAMRREYENNAINISKEELDSWTYQITQGGLNYATMLGLSTVNPSAGLAYMAGLTQGSETIEGMDVYKKKNKGSIEGFEKKSAEELALNLANTSVQTAFENLFGAPAQLKRFRNMKEFLKAGLTGFGEEFTTENLQNAVDALFDEKAGRFEKGETFWTRMADGFKGTVVAGMFGGGAGIAYATYNRSKMIGEIEDRLTGIVPENEKNAVATMIHDSATETLQATVSKELELNSQLRTKHGEIYNRLKQEARKQVEESGAFKDKTEEDIAQHIEEISRDFADKVIAEASVRKVLVDDVISNNDIEYRDGELFLKRISPAEKVSRLYKKTDKPVSALSFIRQNGGLLPHDNLKAMDAQKSFIGLVNKKGSSIDAMGEKLFEAGYFLERPTEAEVLSFIDDELKGKKHYPVGSETDETISSKKQEDMLDHYISMYADEKGIDTSKMSVEEKTDLYNEMMSEREGLGEELPWYMKESQELKDDTERLIDKISEIQKAQESGKPVDAVKAQNDGRNVIEFNVETFKDEDSLKYMRKRMKKMGMSKEEIENYIAYMKETADAVMEMSKEGKHKRFEDWNERDITRFKQKRRLLPVISAFKTNGDYPLNFDLSTLCTRREATNNVVKYLIEKGYAQQLGSTQLEAIKDILKEGDFTTACDICFVESKRLRLLTVANTFAYEWESVRRAMGITDDAKVGTPREFTPEQQNILDQMSALGDKNQEVRQNAFDKYIPEERKRVKLDGKDIDSGITVSKMYMIAKLFKQDPSLAGVFDAEWLLSNQGVDWLLKTFVHTDIRSVLSSMFGTATPKPIEGFNIYDPLSWAGIYDTNNQRDKLDKVFAIGGFRGQSFSDFNSLQAFDYFQFFCDLAIRGLPIHMYTKVPSLIKLFGNTGGLFNMSVVPEMVKGVDKEHSGLRKATEEEIKSGKSKEGFRLMSDEQGTWTYAFNKDSFPVNEAFELRKQYDNAGIIAVGVSDKQIRMMMEDPEIDMIIPYHSSGMALHTRIKTGLNNAEDYTDIQNTGKPKEDKDFSYNQSLRELKDPRKVAKAYLDWCKDKEHGYTPKFEKFAYNEDGSENQNYYKLLEDFRGYDNKGNAIIQQAVNMSKIDPKTFAETLDGILTEREKEVERQEKLYEEKDVKRKIDRLLKKQRLDGVYRDALMDRLKTALGKDNIKSLRQEEFLDQMNLDLLNTYGFDRAKGMCEVFRKNDGVVYGYAKDGKITLNENVFNANTPAHEFTHLWVNIARKVNPKLWEDGKSLLKADKDKWDEVKNDPLYSNIKDDEDAIASEVLSRIVGLENEKLIKGVTDPNLKSLKEKSLITSRIMEWFKKLWGEIRSIFDSYNGKGLTYEEFVHMPLKDLWDETRNLQFNKALQGEGVVSFPELSVEDGTVNQITGLPKKKKATKGSFNRFTKSIKITEKADFSTYQHEFAHFWLDNIWEYMQSGQASQEYIDRWRKVMKWLGMDDDRDYPTPSQHEKFARAYEKYLVNGEIPNNYMGDAFESYNSFIKDVYDSMSDVDVKAGKKYQPLSLEMYDFFDSMTTGKLPLPEGFTEEMEIADAKKTTERNVEETADVVSEETKIIEKEKADYSLEPVQTDTKTGYSRVIEKATGEQVEMGSINLEDQMQKAEAFVANDPERAKRIINGEEKAPKDLTNNVINIAYQRLMEKLGNSDERADSLLKQAKALRRVAQELVSQRLAYADVDKIASPEFWMEQVLKSKASVVADANKMSVSDLQDKIDGIIKEGKRSNLSDEEIINKAKDEIGTFFQLDPEETGAYMTIKEKVENALGLTMTRAEAKEIMHRADDMAKDLRNSMSKTGNPSVQFFVKLKDMENYANSLCPSSRTRIAVSVIGRGNLLFSIKSPLTNVIANTPYGAFRAILRRIILGTENKIDPDKVKQYKKYSWEVFKKTGYNVSSMDENTAKSMYLGEDITHSEGEGSIRKLGRFYEELIYKWSLGAGDVLFKDFAFIDYVSLKASKGRTAEQANKLFDDAILIEPKTEEGKALRQEAIEEALIATFQNDSKLSEAFLKVRKLADFGVGFGEFISPFLKAPVNVVGSGLDLGFGAVKATAREVVRDMKAGKLLKPTQKSVNEVITNGLGFVLALLLASMFDDDDYMPAYQLATSKERQMAKELNIAYNSIRLGNTWFSLDYLGPLASPLIGLLQAKRADNVLDAIANYSKSAGLQTLSLPLFGNVIEIGRDIMYSFNKSGKDIVSGFIDGVLEQAYSRAVPSIVSDFAKALDDYDRRRKGSEYAVRIPFAREGVEKKVSLTSGKAEKVDNAIIDLLFGARVKTQIRNNVADEIERLTRSGYGVTLTDVTDRGQLADLSDNYKTEVRSKFAQEFANRVNQLIKTPSYKKLHDEDKQGEINKIRRKIVKELKNQYLKKAK